jgi:hypothetical protein
MCFYLMMDYVRNWASPAHDVHNIMYLFLSDTAAWKGKSRLCIRGVRMDICPARITSCLQWHVKRVTFQHSKLWSLKGKYDRHIFSQVHKSFVTDDPTIIIVSVRGWFSNWVLRTILFLCRLSLLYEKQNIKVVILYLIQAMCGLKFGRFGSGWNFLGSWWAWPNYTPNIFTSQAFCWNPIEKPHLSSPICMGEKLT